MKEWFIILKDWIPLFQTFLWIGLFVFFAIKYSTKLNKLLEIIFRRIDSGSSIKAGPIELGEELRKLEKVSANTVSASISNKNDWSNKRNGIYKKNKGLFLVHVLEPSKTYGQKYDVFIYLVCHKQNSMEEVEHAEFYFGSYWNNKVFKEKPKNNFLGISTSAYGPFLCICRVKMKNGDEINLSRYIDFEMGRIFEKLN